MKKKRLTLVDEALKNLKTNYSDLFEDRGTQQINPNPKANPNGSSFYEEYKRNNPDLKWL